MLSGLLRAAPRACTRSRSGTASLRGAELILDPAIDPPSHPARDRAVDCGRELEPANEGVHDFIGEVPAVAGVEEVTGRLIRTGGGIDNCLHRERPGAHHPLLIAGLMRPEFNCSSWNLIGQLASGG